MPITDFQKAVIAVLIGQRTPPSHFAGSVPLHLAPSSPRYSEDIDLFHDAESELLQASEADERALQNAGFRVQRAPAAWSTTFRKATVFASRGNDSVEIDWALDSAVRFFPVLPDPDLGWRLHPFDLATNKSLALAGRSATRDIIDIMEWSRCFPLAAIIWAACGKDPGFNPLMQLDMMRRFARISPTELLVLQARSIDPVALKRSWIESATAAEEAITRLADAQPRLPIGVLFADNQNQPRWPQPPEAALDSQGLRTHHPTIGGCWPTLRTINESG